MNRCGALEQGEFSPKKYHALMREAAQFLNDIPPQIQIWHEQMKQRSADQQFEKAQRLKERIAQGQKLLAENYRWVMPLEKFYVLSFQHGPKMKSCGRKKEPTISGFLLSLWGIDHIEPIPLSQADQAAQGLLDHLRFKQLQIETSASLVPSELFAWATQILYKKNQDKNLFLRAQNDLTAEQIAQRIEQHFSRPAQANHKLKLDKLSLTEHKEDDLSVDDPEKKS
jgi:hypothetical protein